MEKPNILIVDDELGPRESLKMILNPNYTVVTARDGNDAISMMKDHQFDLMTLDLKMPGLQGIEVLKNVRKLDSEVEVVIITGYGSLKTAKEAIRYGVNDYITKPFNVAEVKSVIKRSIQKRMVLKKQKLLIETIENILLQDKELKEKGNSLVTLLTEIFEQPLYGPYVYKDFHYLEFIKVLANTLEGQDPYTHGHSERVNYYATIIANELFFSPLEIEELQLAAFLHDIGKLGIFNGYLLKDGKLTKEEKMFLERHPLKGVELITPLGLPPSITSVVRSHHERYDGMGYPDKLKGDDIAVSARIVMIADAFDAMMSDRPYRKALNINKVKEQLDSFAGSQFDPALVNIFLNIINRDGFVRLN